MLKLDYYYIPRVVNRKLTDRRVGPFVIEKMVSKQAAKLVLPKH